MMTEELQIHRASSFFFLKEEGKYIYKYEYEYMILELRLEL